MDTDEEKIIIRQIKEAIAQGRGHADHFGWFPNRDLEEYGIVKIFCEALEKESKSFLDIDSIMMRGRGNDPPDCEAKDIDGNDVGIEVTELVDPKAIVAYKKEHVYNCAAWDRDELLNAINTLLDKKNTRTRIKGGPYSKYILIIHTDEPILNVDYANGILNNYCFAQRDLIDRAFLLISYDPQYKTDPVIELEFKST